MSVYILVSEKYGHICESCYSELDEFQDYIAEHLDFFGTVPGFRYAKGDEIPKILRWCPDCEGCGEAFERHLSESEKMELWLDSESDPYDVDPPQH